MVFAGRLGLRSTFGIASIEDSEVEHGAAQQLFALQANTVGGSFGNRPIHAIVVAVGVVPIVIAVVVVVVVVAIIVVDIMIIIIMIIIMKPRGRLRFEDGPRTFAFRGVRPTAPFGVKEGGRTCTFFVIFNVFLVTN